ncbi:MAG: M16 family metallopeptidase [Bacteroidota bacterium]
MKKYVALIICVIMFQGIQAQDPVDVLGYQVYDKTLANGLKVIVCEKPGGSMAEVQLWYRVGSKDEKPGIRGMAHMFEHMMFRGSKKFPGEGDVFIDSIMAMGGEVNAYTSFDCTVYHETVPLNKMKTVFAMEADRMENLILDQRTLDIERQVVGEELRNGNSNWFRKVLGDVYEQLYPDNHPYRVDVIGYLDTILMFTTKQCQDFYDKYYAPNNCVMIIVGDVKHDDLFKTAETYFGGIKKNIQHTRTPPQAISAATIRCEEFSVDFPVQLYGYLIPQPAVGQPDYHSFIMAKDLLFGNPNAILPTMIVDEQRLAYGMMQVSDNRSLFSSYCQIYIPMNAAPGNIKVKKMISGELISVFEEGFDDESIAAYISHLEAQQQLNAYNSKYIADLLGKAELYYPDYRYWNEDINQFKKLDAYSLSKYAKKYFTTDAFRVVNIKPIMN